MVLMALKFLVGATLLESCVLIAARLAWRRSALPWIAGTLGSSKRAG
jgi:hypothetical protein